ncbi:aminopeptidase M1-A-like [Aegilops tauschii subsp. strangulata]|uniref:aminopeptidase M1-A-like n=1 Tax=Triticum aestivum TaxID=4565 RepID=UPI001ABC6AAD|nr:aminopeptidase M1-A-like [Triticum aestivum]
METTHPWSRILPDHPEMTSMRIFEMMDLAAPEEMVNMKNFLIDFLEPFALRAGWEAKSGQGNLNVLLRGTLLTALAELGHQSTIDEVVRRFNHHCVCYRFTNLDAFACQIKTEE